MNTEANIAFVKKAYADFLAGDIPTILSGLSDEVEWITPGTGIPTAGARHGKAEVREFFQTVAATWEFTNFEAREYIASGDMVTATGSYTAISRATRRSVTSEWVMLWKIQNGKLTRFREFTDTQALAAALTARATA
jgi:ketosteroid isomerase-like protein